jgi:two-component system LytT family response regulator
MNPVRAMVVEDNPIARARLIALLSDDRDVDVVASCSDGREALMRLPSADPHVLFVDIELPELDGFELIERVGGPEPPIVVFVTASTAHAVRAFDARVFDYVLKPFGRERIASVLGRLKHELAERATAARVTSLARELCTPEPPSASPARLAIRVDGTLRVIPSGDILTATGAGNYVTIETVAGRLLVRHTMSALEAELGDRFLRVHRSTIINVDRVYALRPLGGGGCEIHLTTGQPIRVPRAQRRALEERLAVRTAARH